MARMDEKNLAVAKANVRAEIYRLLSQLELAKYVVFSFRETAEFTEVKVKWE